MAQGYAIRVKNVCLSGHGHAILNHIDLDVKKGEFITILGPNGSGKTSLLKTILGFYKAGQGEIFVNQENTKSKIRSIRKNIAYMPQRLDMDPYFPILVKDVLVMGRSGKGILKRIDKNDRDIIRSVEKEFKIHHLLNKPFGLISGGERQKVMLAFVLIQKPEILFLDEPNVNLDIQAYKKFLKMVEKIYIDHRLTVLFVTHLITHISEFSNRIVVLKNGHVIFQGQKKELWEKKDFLSYIYD
ncbi:MAG: ATP-binding cassette domain-containing protein [Spirochaetes bacterium]|nr:ATP-binding cassette domain-containing protein [Spirochaetota bacterium]